MGPNASKAEMDGLLRSTILRPLSFEIAIVLPLEQTCFPTARRWIARSRSREDIAAKVSKPPTSGDVTVRLASDCTRHPAPFTIDGAHVLRDATNEPTVTLLTFAQGNEHEIVDLRSGRSLLTLESMAAPSAHAHGPSRVVTEFQDPLTGHAYVLGVTGDWQRDRGLVVWLAMTLDGRHIPVGKIYEAVSHNPRERRVCVEVAAGMDTALVLLVYYAIDCVPVAKMAGSECHELR